MAATESTTTEKTYQDLTGTQQDIIDAFDEYPAATDTKIAYEADTTAGYVWTIRNRYPHLLEAVGVRVE